MKRIITIIIIVFSIFGCESDSALNSDLQNSVNSADLKENVIQLKQKAIVPLLVMAKNKEFKKFILDECLKQEHGEYNVYFLKIIEKFKDNPKYNESINELTILSNKIKVLNGGLEPLLFYPRAETIEETNYINDSQRKTKNARLVSIDDNTLAVNQDVYYSNNTSPGYILNTSGLLIFQEYITEKFAWNNDVWVIGQEEDVPNNQVYGDDSSFFAANFAPPSRLEGQGEFGGILQVTDLGAIEPWVSGKLEFSIIVRGINGTELRKDFDKRRRKNFTNRKWYDYNYFIGNWNTAAFGTLMVEKWLELDGGKSSTVTYTIPPSIPGGVTTTISIPSKERDDDLGQTIVQFTDQMSQVYNLSHINIMRKH